MKFPEEPQNVILKQKANKASFNQKMEVVSWSIVPLRYQHYLVLPFLARNPYQNPG